MTILDAENNLLAVQLVGYLYNEWNFSGGEKKGNETPEENLARELAEELGITKKDYSIISKSSKPFQYDFTRPLIKDYGITYLGQIKDQFVVRFIGDKYIIKILEDEITQLKWITFAELKDHLVFKGRMKIF